MKKTILKETSGAVLKYLQENDTGDGISIDEIATALGKEPKQVRPTITLSLGKAAKDGSRGVLATYEKRDIEGEEKPVGYAVLTDEGRNFVDEVVVAEAAE